MPTSPAETLPAVAEATSTPAVTPTPCINSLDFVDDVSVPDGTVVSPGTMIDKQWLVLNDGSCPWDHTYRLRFVAGDPLAATEDQALVAAAPGAQVTLRIVFTAPPVPGRYFSKWQALAPDGTPFGSEVYLDITVAS